MSEQKSPQSTIMHERKNEGPVYKAKDRVYAKDGVGIYAADVLKVALKPLTSHKGKSVSTATIPPENDSNTMVWSYQVHYLGWNKKWDRWVLADELLPDDENGRRLHQEFQLKEQERREQEKKEAEAKKLAKKRKKLQKIGKHADDQDACSISSAGIISGDSGTPIKPQSLEDPESVSGSDPQYSSKFREEAENKEAPVTKKLKVEQEPTVNNVVTQVSQAQNHIQHQVYDQPKPSLELPLTLKIMLVDDREKIAPSVPYKQPSPNEWYCCRFLPCLPTNAITVKQCIETFLTRKISQLKQKLKRRKKDPIQKPNTIPKVIGDDKSISENGDDNHPDGLKEEELQAMQLWRNISEDILETFDLALAPMLLYNQERAQYFIWKQKCQQKKVNVRHCEIYSVIYLLRFLVRLPIILEQILPNLLSEDQNQERASAKRVSVATEWKHTEPFLEELIRYIQRNQSRFFPHNYRTPHDYELTPVERKLKEQAHGKSTTVTAKKG